MTETLPQDDAVKTVLKFSKEAQKQYLQGLNTALETLCSELEASNVLSVPNTRFHQVFSDIIGVYTYEEHQGQLSSLSVSASSGLPLVSSIMNIVFDKKRSIDHQKKVRESQDILQDMVNSVYLNDPKRAGHFLEEHLQACYYRKLEDIGKFEEVSALNEEEDRARSQVKHYHIDLAQYPLSEMSCITLHIELNQPSTRLWTNKIKLLPFEKAITYPVEHICQIAWNEDHHPALIKKSSISRG